MFKAKIDVYTTLLLHVVWHSTTFTFSACIWSVLGITMKIYWFQLIDVFGSLLERPLIKQDFQPNYPKVVTMMDQELAIAKTIYDDHMRVRKESGNMPLHKNMAKVK